MQRSIRSWWFLFATTVALAIGAILWVTVVVLDMERKELRVEAEILHQESLRLALWRMDSWLVPRIAQEASRPYIEYQSFIAQDWAYTPLLNEIEPGAVLTPSPLLLFDNEFFPLHFNIEAGIVSSPQVPTGNYRDIAEAQFQRADSILQCTALLDEITPIVLDDDVMEQVRCSVANYENATMEAAATPSLAAAADDSVAQLEQVQQDTDRNDKARRAQAARAAQTASQDPIARRTDYRGAEKNPDVVPPSDFTVMETEAAQLGPFVPIWLPPGDRLALIRQGRVDGREVTQGILVDWESLHRELKLLVSDVFPGAELEPIAVESLETARAPEVLATLPARFVSNSEPASPRQSITTVRATLAIAWISLATVILASGLALRSSVALGRKRHRFASAVTHELRTPLTTFRMYSEMLADGMVPEEQRGEYYETLKTESNRLATLVENVLGYARLEEGRATRRIEDIEVRRLLDKTLANARERAAASSMQMEVDVAVDPDVTVRTDPDRIEQILFNLIDNACKYASGDDRRIHVAAIASGPHLEIRVRDHGPGIPPGQRRSIFGAFKRGEHDGDAISGVGLGLALSRGLAEDLGGSLDCESPEGPGACFVLRVPRG